MENFNNNKERKKLFKRVDKMKKMQREKNAKVKTKSMHKLIMMSAVLVLIIMLILMVFRQNAIIISRQDPEHYRSMTYEEVQPGEEATNSEYVQFDAYFLKDINNDGIADKVRGTCNEIGTSDDLYMDLTVLTNGYLKDAKITINSYDSEEKGNFYLSTEIAADSQVKQDYVSGNTRTIEFNQLENGTHILLSGKVNTANYGEYRKLYTAIRTENDYNKINSVVLTGTHVEILEDGSTKETKVEKKVEFQVDWYGTLNVRWSMFNSQTNDADVILDKDNNLLNIEFGLGLQDVKGEDSQLKFKTGHIEGILPEINGYAPTEVKLTNNIYGSTITYDKDTRKFIIEGNDFESDDYGYREYIQVSYPIEAYNAETDSEKSIEVQVKGWIEGYNNPNEEFQNPYKSNEVEETLKIKLIRNVTVPSISCRVGEYIYTNNSYIDNSQYMVSKEKPARIYNGISTEEKEDYYEVVWYVVFNRNNGELPNGVILKESKYGDKSDEFIKSDSSTDSMKNLTTNIGIYFYTSYLDETLGENGWLKVYNDDTDELLVTFTKDNWSQYNTEENMYKYAEPVKHIRIETSAIDASSFNGGQQLSIYNIKELDDEYITAHYTKEEFDNLTNIKSYLYMYTQTSVGEKEATDYDIADYIYPITGVGMDLDNNGKYYQKAIVSTQQERDMKIRIGIPDSYIYNYDNDKLMAKWIDGEYLIKLPKDIIDLKINSITPDKENIQITNYETYEEEGNIYIKIKTKNETPEFYTITLDCTITPNPGSPTQDEEVELYAFNKNAAGDYEPEEVEDTYDVNDNGNVSEIIGYTTRTISFVASNSLVTGQRASNYDEKGNIAISPKIAYVSKSQRTAQIDLSVINNYSGTIGEIDILGKIPTQGNTFVINGNDLGSTYSTTMTSAGVQIPEELKSAGVTVYYSEQINPTKDLEEPSNGWTTTPTDFSKVKSFLIDLGDYVLAQKESHTFTYEVNIPEGLDYNEVSYSHHGVYFTLNTNAGKLYEQTEPAKLGLMIAEPYNIEITKYERKTNTVVPGATYSVAEDGGDEVIGITNEEGKLTIKDLFAEHSYTLKETISPEGYELNPEEIKFEVYEENGELKLQINSGTVRKAEMATNEHGDKVLKIEVEDGKTEDKVTVPVHHYIYDEKNGGYTTNKVKISDGTQAQDETITGWVGDSYETKAVENLDSNYELYESPENAVGILSKDMGEINYYYKLKESSITSSVEKTASTSKIATQTDGTQIPVLTQQDGIVTYNIKYSTSIENYKGKAKIVVTDKLPAGIDETAEGVDLAEGTYDEETKTITWTKEVEEIDTYTDGTYTYNFDETIKLVYKNQDLTSPLVNTAYGEVTTYYEDDYGPNPGGEKDKNKSEEVTATVTQEYKVDKTVTKIWNHGGNKEEKPQEITLQIKNGDEVVAEETVNEEDGWKYTFEDLPKYDENGDEIEYTADEKEILEEYNKEIEGLTVTNTYKGAVITASKLARTERNNGYVVAGEKITYTIVVRNTGGLAKEVEVKDQAPEGTTFVEGSIKVDNVAQENLTQTDLQNGIRVNVPAKGASGEDGETRVSFEVTVNEGVTGEIKNAGTIKESETIEEETNEVTTPVVKISKTAEIKRNTQGELGANEVTVGDEITYKIKVENISETDLTQLEIEDSIPEGTSLKQINNNGVQEESKIKWQIDVDKNSSMEVSFVVTVEYEGEDTSIKNVATVDGNKTNEIENPYKKQESTVESNITKEGEEKITTPDEAVYYEIKYEATIEDHVGSAKVTIVDKLPYEINEQESELAGGTYDAEAKTITWEEDITNIDTYRANSAKEITRTKAISLKYDYGNIDEIGASVRNEVEGKIELKEGDEITKTDTVTGEHTEKVEIPARVIVHHYIYDEETDEYTEEKLVADEEKEGIVGESYTTTKSSSVPQNYECINETPEKYQGKMTYEDIEVTYYYKLKESSITSTIEKTATANKVIDGVPVLTDEKDQVTYKIKYNTQINDYIGKATIIVTDNLPAQIDERSSDLAGGKYDSKNNTITWEEEVDVDTFTNGGYTYNFDKTIKLVYVNQDVTEDLVNEVRGEIKLYYPENYPEKGGEEVKTDEKEETATVKQEYKVDKKVEKIWEDNNDIKGKRPNSVLVELTADGEIVENTQVELNSKNGWEHTYRDLAKYDEYGYEIEYSIIEEEKNAGDLEYYEEPEINGEENIIVTNRYELKETALDSDITKETQAVITASNQEVPYTIHYEAQIDEYIGEALVTIVDELPYKIDEEKSNLDGGVYNEELQTITWKEELGHINTDTMGEAYKVDVTKNIVLVYKDLDVTESMVTNKVKGTVELYETEEKNTVETEENVQVEVEGTVVVKYVEKESGKELETAEEMKGRVGEEYVTLAKDIENYTLVGDTENTKGKYKEGIIEVIYYYEKTPAKVIIKYEDEKGKDILEEKVVEGYVSEEYETKAEEIEGYELVDVIGQESGVMTEDDIVIIYVYKHIEAGGVRVEYIDKETGEKLAEDEVIKGNVGDEYKTERKVIENYQKAEPEPTNKEGTMTEEEIVVTYYYEKIPSGKVIVKYVDRETKEEIRYTDDSGEEKTYGYEITGYVGEEYKTEEKEIPYYKIVENILPVNREGILSQNDETVIYYYDKMSFNMEISKKVKTITIKGEEKEVNNGSLSKVEIHRKEITTTPVEIKYVITVRNTGEIDGKGEVIEKIPEGFEVSSNNPKEWVINADGTMKYAVELKAGESKDIEVVLKWKASETNFGEKKNVALLTNIENPAGFEEENAVDNEAEATVIVTVATGKEISILIIVLGFIASAGSLILCYEYELYRKERNQPVRMVKLDGKNVVIRKEVQK